AVKMAAALLFAAPALPLLFMGEEYGETSPFQYFTSHLDPALVEAVRKGRTEEFKSFGWQGTVPDPSEPATFLRSRLNHPLAAAPPTGGGGRRPTGSGASTTAAGWSCDAAIRHSAPAARIVRRRSSTPPAVC